MLTANDGSSGRLLAYYDTSLDGEDLVGWHLNRAMNQASDFFSVGRFRDRFYRPEIIQSIVQTMRRGRRQFVGCTAAAAAALAATRTHRTCQRL
jgi:hypothetical protein